MVVSTRRLAALIVITFLSLGSRAHAQNGLVIASAETGATVDIRLDGLCAGCTATDADAVIDASLSNHAAISLPLAVAGEATVTVAFGAAQPAGADVGLALRSGGLSASVLDVIAIETVLAGTLQESVSGASALRLTEGTEVSILGFTTTAGFDEVRLRLGSLATVSAALDVFYAVAASDLPETMRSLGPGSGASVRVGTLGACATCAVVDAGAVIDGVLPTATSLSVGAGSGGSVYLDLALAAAEAGGGRVGFALAQGDGLADSQLLSTLTLTTFLDGSPQESGSGDGLTLTAIGGVLRGVTLATTLPFDLVRLEMAALPGGSLDNVVEAFFPLLPVGAGSGGGSGGGATSGEAGPGAPALAVRVLPNPVAASGRLVLTAEAGPARAELFDALGRRVSVLFDGTVGSGTESVALATRGLPGGVYLVRLVQGAQTAVAHVTVLGR